MRTIFRFKLGTNSLFTQLFISFLAVILLLLSFNYFSFSFYQNNIRDEIIKYNDVNLDHTTENYESYFELLYKLSLGFYFRDSVQTLAKNHEDYAASNYIVRNEINSVLSIPKLYLDNFMLYINDNSLVLEQGGTARAQTMFTKFYHSTNYPYAFWKGQFDSPYGFRLFPAANFEEIGLNKEITSSKQLFSFIVKNKLYPDFYLIAFIDANKLFQTFHQSINKQFYIADSDGQPVYASQLTASEQLPAFTGAQGAIRQGSYYYFYKKGTVTGFTYVNTVPLEEITSQISRLRLTLWSVLLAALAIGLITSILFTIRFHSPVKKIISSIQSIGGHAAQPSRIKEFALIGENIRSMLEANRNIHQSMNDSKALLQYYALTNRIKKITMNLPDLQELIVNPNPYLLVLYELKFKRRYKDEIGIDREQAVFYLKECIDLCIAGRHRDSLTFPIESDQLLSIVFLPPENPPILDTLQRIVSMMEVDRDYYFAAIAVSGTHHQPAEFTDAYEQALTLLNNRPIHDSTEILSAPGRKNPPEFVITVEQEYELNLHLYAGNCENTLQLIRRTLGAMQRKQATALRCAQFANDVLSRILNVLRALSLESPFIQRLPSPQQQLQECYTIQDYERFFTNAVTEATLLIRDHKEAADPIVDFVVQYLERHYAQDITLDIVADKLGISSGYLSTYFKEKTQKNFIDYVNEVRVANAKTLLRESGARIQEIAAGVGYQNMNSFNRMFKKFTSMTPSEFRMKHKQ
ncbi:helix-turn-helix domain-containing protein [Paenibacillus rhizovicinus]|uniref:Helix-turn-helix domain-containing protein n=1 Tax=Paenibacillus rhizovicinus TaxID=2704463 RepID=A0A6C0P656_9BACL|nr:helix-turn-helix domain-containing protein [Paenibacillus rhizovicinus]QHW33998.1 helix-turn-helix domain-containing protein [Paenibacillus rhizovicinus]